ncbi:Arm DNA-binding domain-containing protein, partial [Frateuria sp.]|uniref:Arm DNA-binding domain-containing protein n=1 Tax=Frateuria sp. TaxID=2211372 RepID=UPI003F7FE808
MPKLAKPLTELQISKAKPKPKAYNLADGNGLHLAVSPAGLKTWTVRYKLPGAKTATPATIGHSPAMSVAEARVRA